LGRRVTGYVFARRVDSADRPVRATAPLVVGGFAPGGEQLASFSSLAPDSLAVDSER